MPRCKGNLTVRNECSFSKDNGECTYLGPCEYMISVREANNRIPDVFNDLEKYFQNLYSDWGGVVQFEGSGARLRRLYEEMCWPSSKIDGEVTKQLKSVFPCDYSEMLVEGPINVWTLCPHHILPCHFKVHIGYVPKGGVLGLSKFSRVSVALAKRPIMQEQYTSDLADCLEKSLEPIGLGVHVVGTHGCMECRGVLQEEAVVTTVVLRGAIMNEPETRREFYNNIKRDK
jgi:GTP cyclohydrolase IA